MEKEQFLWVDKYRPRKVADCILPDGIKDIFQSLADQKNIPNMILGGTPGIGKTTIARALCEEIGNDYILINGSKERGIDTFRVKVTNYASSVSFMGGRKVVIIDEADGLTGDAQDALRGMVEEFSTNCSFILTCNHKNKIKDAIQSRCPSYDIKIPKELAPKIAITLCKRIETILKDEGVEYDQKAIIELVKKFFPDFRRVLGELQKYSSTGKIDSGIFSSLGDIRIGELISYLREKDFRSLRKWVGVNSDQDASRILRELYDKLSDCVKPEFVPVAIIIIGKWMYQDAFAADHEISLAACLTEIMLECEMLKS